MKKYSRVGRVALRYDTTPSTIWRWAKEERFAYLGFPKAIPLGPNTSAFDDDELDAYDERRKALRDAETGT